MKNFKSFNSFEQLNNNGFLTELTNYSAKRLEENNVALKFPKEIASIPASRIKETPCPNRMDLRNIDVFTIDSADTKDMDDAISLSYDVNTGIFNLGVHIADVSAYVMPGTNLDMAAMDRGVSIYLPHITVPMLPSVLSDNLCSLNPDEDRNTISVLMKLDNNGKLLSADIVKSKIRSRIKGTYAEVNSILYGNASAEVCFRYASLMDSIIMMDKLAKVLREHRRAQGATLNDYREPKIEFDGEDLVLTPYVIGPAENLIEEFMVLANHVIAVYFSTHQLPTLYRTQNERNCRAEYRVTKNHHAELALEQYAHFTSPIRRLADLRVHQVLSMHLAGCSSFCLHTLFDSLLEDSCSMANKRSRRADDLMYSIEKYCYLNYFQSRQNIGYCGIAEGFSKLKQTIIRIDQFNICVFADSRAHIKLGQHLCFNVHTKNNSMYAYNIALA